MIIDYADYYDRLSKIYNETLDVIRKVPADPSSDVIDKITDCWCHFNDQAPLRIVFIGEFSAGKSSIISALTGEDIVIDADEATDGIAEYPWRGFVLVDTPGVHGDCDLTDHDMIAMEATVGADLLFFVITNELFNSRLAEHLIYVIGGSGLDLHQKSSIIVNKMDRETNPYRTKLRSIADVLGDYSEVPVYFCSASKYLQSLISEPPLKQRFEKQSQFGELITGINDFINNAGFKGRLSTPLQVMVESLEQVQSSLVQSDNDRSIIELIRRQRYVLNGLQQSLIVMKKNWKQQAYSIVVSKANDAVEQITEQSIPEDIESLFIQGMKESEGEILALFDGLRVELGESVRRACEELDDIGDSPLGQYVAKIESNSGIVSVDIKIDKPSESNINPFLNKIGKPLQDMLDKASGEAETFRQIYYTVGKKMGKKFKPWEAVKGGQKAAEYAGKLGKAVPYIMVAFDAYTQYKEEKLKEDKLRYLATMRNVTRSIFIDQAKIESDIVEEVINNVSNDYVRVSLERLEEKESDIISRETSNHELKAQITQLRKKCSDLKNDLYFGSTQSFGESD